MSFAAWVTIAVFLVLMFLRVPVFISVMTGTCAYLALTPTVNGIVVVQKIITGMSGITLLAIPFFIFSGILMNTSGITRRIMNLCVAITGRYTGSLAQVNVLLSTMMGGLSGSNLADAAMEAKLLVPEMEERGYSKEFSSVVTAVSSMITPLIPPGIGLIVYGSLASASVGRLFAAGISVGLMLMVAMLALSENLREICELACRAAKRHGVKISCDLNYRKSLWSTEQAKKAMTPLMQYVDLLIANEEDSDKVLGVKASDTDITQAKLSVDGYISLARNLVEEYGFEAVAITLRESVSASINNWSALYFTDDKAYLSKKYTMYIVDRVGGGDSFASGLIYALLNGFDKQKSVEFAAGASCLKHSIEYDFNLSTPDEVLNLINGDGSGRVVR